MVKLEIVIVRWFFIERTVIKGIEIWEFQGAIFKLKKLFSNGMATRFIDFFWNGVANTT